MLFISCGGGDSSSSLNQNDNNQTIIDNNSSRNEENSTNQNSSDIETNNNQPINNNENTIENNNTTNNENNHNNPPIIEITKNGKAQLGVLAKATVKLYELTKEERKLLAIELTTVGDSIKSIGNFNLHLEKLKDNKLYLYEVSKGEDYDVNDDGNIDETSTKNSGTFHLLVLGSHIKRIKYIRITALSEIVYQKLYSSLKLSIDTLINNMKYLSKEIIEQDINGDGFIGIEDILKYNPITDKTKLYIEYQNKMNRVIYDILNNKKSDFDTPIFNENSEEIQVNENLTFIKKIEIEDKSKFTITLLGLDRKSFNYDIQTKELSFKTPINFENPQDNNRDNIFELTIEAVDSYFNKSSKKFSIKILDVNETTPKVPILKDSNLSIYENNLTNALIGSIHIQNQGTEPINKFTLIGEDAQLFKINQEGKVFSNQVFDFEDKSIYSLKVEATNGVGVSNKVSLTINIKDIPDIKPTINSTYIHVYENTPIGTIIGKANINSNGDSNISSIVIYGYFNNNFHINVNGDIEVKVYLDYEAYSSYFLQYSAINKVGESEKADLIVYVENIYENFDSDYPPNEDGIQSALDNGDYNFVLNQLLNNRDAYSDMDDNTVNMNIAGAYVESSGYTIYDITGAMKDGNSSSFNDFVNNITKDNDATLTINRLKQADNYYSRIVQGIDCNDTSNLTTVQKDSCYNLGLVRLTSLTNGVKLLFGGESTTVKKWAEGVDVNSSDDLCS